MSFVADVLKDGDNVSFLSVFSMVIKNLESPVCLRHAIDCLLYPSFSPMLKAESNYQEPGIKHFLGEILANILIYFLMSKLYQ